MLALGAVEGPRPGIEFFVAAVLQIAHEAGVVAGVVPMEEDELDLALLVFRYAALPTSAGDSARDSPGGDFTSARCFARRCSMNASRSSTITS